jgi:hypothetical protein
VDGRRVFLSSGNTPEERVVYMYDTEEKTVTELAKGPGNTVLAVWRDPNTNRDWVYVNSTGDQGEKWDEPKGGAIYRFPADEPEARELFRDRTSSHFFLMFSADGTRACFEPSWSNIGQLKLAFNDDGTVDQDESEYKRIAGGCFPSMAPDHSYRLFTLGGGLDAKDGELTGFEIAGSDGEFVRATAVIQGNKVAVSSPDVATPAAVRYGWGTFFEANLFNKAGLPASPFRTGP